MSVARATASGQDSFGADAAATSAACWSPGGEETLQQEA